MFEIILGITLFISVPAAYLITTENAKTRGLFKKNALWQINVNIKEKLTLNDKLDVLQIAYFLKYGDFYFAASRYRDAVNHYKRVLHILTKNYFRNEYYKNVFQELYENAINRLSIGIKEYGKYEKRKKILNPFV